MVDNEGRVAGSEGREAKGRSRLAERMITRSSLLAPRPSPLTTGSSLLAIFLLSASAFAFEIVATRLFSLFFQYHYTFLAVSLAVLGVSLGAALAHLWGMPGDERCWSRWLFGALLTLGVAFPVVAVGLAWLPLSESILLHALLALFPFTLIGLCLALLFGRFGAQSGLLYAADLVGAAFGLMGAVSLLQWWSPFTILLLLGCLMSGAALVTALFLVRSKPGLVAGALVVLAGVGLCLANLTTDWLTWPPAHLTGAPRDKTMLTVLNDPAQAAHIVQTAWSPFARVDVVETNDPAAKFVFTDGGAGSYMLHFDGNLEAVQALRNTPEFLPFAMTDAAHALILGAGAGKDVLLALLDGVQQVSAVEVNPALVATTRAFGDYNGHIFDQPQVQLTVGDARTFVERSQTQYDLIYLNLVYTQAAAPGSLALVENYVFTQQAFQAYLQHLTPGGHLALVTHNALEGSRAMLTALQALANLGIAPAQALDHLSLWMLANDDPTLRTSVLLVGKGPLTTELVQMLSTTAQPLDLQPLFAPGQFEAAFAPLRQGMGLAAFVQEDAAYDLSPSDDSRPFFFKLDPGLPAPVRWTLVLATVLTLACLGMGVIQRPSPSYKRGGSRQDAPLSPRTRGAGGEEQTAFSWWAALPYAVLIGIGFMGVELPLIQRLQLLLGYPVLALSTVVGALLLGGGAGSLISQRWPAGALSRWVMLAALWVSGIALFYAFALPPLIRLLLPAPFAMRFLATVALAALPGVGLGIPFPSLLRHFPHDPGKVALLWSINGASSVLGSALAVAIAMSYGLPWALTGGAFCYGLVALLVWRMTRH